MNCAAYFKCARCLVEASQADGWVAQIEDRQAGPYFSRDVALRVAVADAKALYTSGRSVRLIVKDKAGDIRAEHCLCARFNR